MDLSFIRALSYDEALACYREVLERSDVDEMRAMCRADRFFLMTCILGRDDAMYPWVYERCREVEQDPDGWLDLWSRFHFKSSIITQVGSVQEILKDPEITIGIFSNVRPLAEQFVGQIQAELEKPALVKLFPDILWEKPPQRRWSKQTGLFVRRKGNPKEATVSGNGLVEGLRAGPHYRLRIYDDIVTEDSVNTPEMIQKTTKAWELSLSMGTLEGAREQYVGTRYHPDDTYGVLIERKAVRVRIRTCYDGAGRSVMMQQHELDALRAKQGDRTFSAQMLQNPISAGTRTFKDAWFHTLEDMPGRELMNVYLLIDSANAKRKTSDYTVMIVVGLGRDKNYYILDALRDKLNLAERTRALFDMVERWAPNAVFWEQIGCQSDAAHVVLEQNRVGWHFPIIELDQSVPKPDRIGWLVPIAESGRLWFPNRIMRRSVLGETYDWVHDFEHYEFGVHPVCRHDDMLDCLANISHPTFLANSRFPVVPRAVQDSGQEGQTKSEWKPF